MITWESSTSVIVAPARSALRKAKARTLEALFEATAEALGAVSADDARGYFEHCGYVKPQDHPL